LRITLLFTDIPKSSDCNLSARLKIFEPKFAIVRTEWESIIVNCIDPMIALNYAKNQKKRILFPLLLTL